MIINRSHDDLEFIYRLIINDIALRLGLLKDIFADRILESFNIVRAEKPRTYRRGFPVASEHVSLKSFFGCCLIFVTGEVFGGWTTGTGSAGKIHASVLSGIGHRIRKRKLKIGLRHFFCSPATFFSPQEI